jgi:hypothetical protein
LDLHSDQEPDQKRAAAQLQMINDAICAFGQSPDLITKLGAWEQAVSPDFYNKPSASKRARSR